jgi:hypothetical protein
MEQNIERELAITGRTVEFLASGTPVIYNDYATLSKLIQSYGAGWTLSPSDPFAMRQIFAELVKHGPALVDELSRKAQNLAKSEFSEEECTAPLVNLCLGPVQKRLKVSPAATSTSRASRQAKLPPALGRVLAISPDRDALVELRVSNPLRALQRQGYIHSMTIVEPYGQALKEDTALYDAIVVHRAVPRFIYQTLANLSIDFLQDIDDNTLARAAYRREIPPETEILDGLRYCKVLTTPNPRLVRGLEKYSGMSLAGKTFITPNALPFPSPPRSRELVQPNQIIWIQSDIAALAESRDEVVKASFHFRGVRGPLVAIGACR